MVLAQSVPLLLDSAIASVGPDSVASRLPPMEREGLAVDGWRECGGRTDRGWRGSWSPEVLRLADGLCGRFGVLSTDRRWSEDMVVA